MWPLWPTYCAPTWQLHRPKDFVDYDCKTSLMLRRMGLALSYDLVKYITLLLVTPDKHWEHQSCGKPRISRFGDGIAERHWKQRDIFDQIITECK